MSNSPLLESRLDFLSAELLPKEDNLLDILVAMVSRAGRRSFQVHMDRFSIEILDSDVRRRLDNPEGEPADDILGVLAALTVLDQFGFITFEAPADLLSQRVAQILLTVLPAANMRVAHRKKNQAAQTWELLWLRAGSNFTSIIAIVGFILAIVNLFLGLK